MPAARPGRGDAAQTALVQLSWRPPASAAAAWAARVHRRAGARRGALRRRDHARELSDDEPRAFPLFPVTSRSATSRRRQAHPHRGGRGSFAARLRGRGTHRLQLRFSCRWYATTARRTWTAHSGVPVTELEIDPTRATRRCVVSSRPRTSTRCGAAAPPVLARVPADDVGAAGELGGGGAGGSGRGSAGQRHVFHLAHAEEGVLYVHAVAATRSPAGSATCWCSRCRATRRSATSARRAAGSRRRPGAGRRRRARAEHSTACSSTASCRASSLRRAYERRSRARMRCKSR